VYAAERERSNILCEYKRITSTKAARGKGSCSLNACVHTARRQERDRYGNIHARAQTQVGFRREHYARMENTVRQRSVLPCIQLERTAARSLFVHRPERALDCRARIIALKMAARLVSIHHTEDMCLLRSICC